MSLVKDLESHLGNLALMNVTIKVLAIEFFVSQFNHNKGRQKPALVFTLTAVVTIVPCTGEGTATPLPYLPLHHCKSIIEPGSKHIPSEVFC